MAEGKIKGITVEIGGNTDPLAKALKEMNKPLNSMQKELKGIESLLKMDPSNVDLLRQKEELLNKSIGETESKLEALKKAKDAADKQMANGTKVNQTEYRNLVREIASTEQKLERLTDSMKEFGSVGAQQVKKVGDDMKDLGDKMQNVGGKMSTMVTAPVLAGFALATEGTRELRGDLARLEVNAEQAGKSLEGMEDYMTQIVGVTGEVDSSIEGLSNLLASGFSDAGFAEIMDALSGAAIKFSDTLKFEGIADGLQETLATGAAVGPFAELLERSGLVLDDFNAGLQAAIANGQTENFILQTLAQTGLADFYAAYREGNPDLVEAAEAQYRLQVQLAELGSMLEPIQTKLVEFATMILEKFNSLSPSMQTFILAIVGIAAALGPVIVVLGSLLTGLGSLLAMAPQLVTALGVVKAAFAAIGGPVTIVIAIITALVLKFVHAYNTSEEFRNKVNAAWESVKSCVSNAAGKILGMLENMVSYYKNAANNIKTAWNNLISWFKGKISEFINIGKNIVDGLWKGISSGKDWLIGKIKSWCGSILNGILSFFGIHSPSRVIKEEVGKNIALGMAEGIETEIPSVVDSVDAMGETLLSEFDRSIGDLQSEVESRAGTIAGMFDTEAEFHALTKLSDDGLDEFGENYAQKIKTAVETAVNELDGLQLAITPVVNEMAANASYAKTSVNDPIGEGKKIQTRTTFENLIRIRFEGDGIGQLSGTQFKMLTDAVENAISQNLAADNRRIPNRVSVVGGV